MSTEAIPPGTRAAIEAALDAVEREEGVAILFAAESGSRAWGFPSPDSDWDIRFVYARPTDWYLTLNPGRDVIERMLPGDMDMAGWDARKALNLLLAGNVALREWLHSPILYRADDALLAAFRDLAALAPARATARHHYRSLASKSDALHLADRPAVKLKKYLYAVRPALALRWLREHPSGEPPMDLPSLLAGVTLDAAMRADLQDLLERKRVASELGEGPRIPSLDALIRDEIEAARSDESRTLPDAARLAAEALHRTCIAHADSRR